MYEFGKFYDMPVDLITVAQGGLRPAEVKSPQFQGLMRSNALYVSAVPM